MDGQTRVKVVKDLVLTPKRIKLFLISCRKDSHNTVIYGLLFSSSLEEADKGALVDVLVSDLEAILILICSWKTSKGTLGTLDVYCSSVVFPLLLLPLRLSWYSSISQGRRGYLALNEDD